MSATALLDKQSEAFQRPAHLSALGSYRDPVRAVGRELVLHERSDCALVLIDQIAADGADARLVAILAADEPPENAELLCTVYLRDRTRGRCRLVRPEDLQVPQPLRHRPDDSKHEDEELLDAAGYVYRLARVQHPGPARLQWTRRRAGSDERETVTLRSVVGALEAYEPARSMTEEAIEHQRFAGELSTALLRTELGTLSASTIVLNRGLREAVLRRLAEGASPRLLAERCGHFKGEGRGRPSGDATWLKRRIGVTPTGGSRTPTPWVSLDVLELIARDALAVHPSEVAL